jgi:glycosyltransferase involved in cell wall biosynthesis
MNILVLCEGDAETRDSWSGITNSVVTQLRADGHTVRTGDVDLYRLDRWETAIRTFVPNRERWRVRFRLGAQAFRRRSERADRYIRSQSRPDLVLQIGATFAVDPGHRIPYVLYCDSNIRMAEHSRESGHTQATHLDEDESRAVREREARVYSGAAAIFTISERLRRSFIEDFGIPERRVRAVHAGPNFDVDAFVDVVAPEPERPTILFVGKQFRRKGGDVLLSAFADVRARFPDARLIIVGPEELADVPPGVEHWGFLNKDDPHDRQRLIEAYRSADVFCLPTRFEPFGIVYLEAMYFGLPCVGTNVGAVPEMIADGQTGFTVPVDDAHLLAERLNWLIEHRPQARAMGRAGLERARDHFSWRAVIDRMMETLAEVLPAAFSDPRS